jgi:hypothetical protein
MIISASYKTDIPTFYGQWFMNRLREGNCRMINPYNRQVIDVSLKNEDVDGFVFWTKNIGPFMKHLPEIRRRGFAFVVQHTINGYPRELEHSVVDDGKSIENVRQIAQEFGPRTCVWRYDPIVFSSLTPEDFHRRNFEQIARKLSGAVDEVVVSVAQVYRKTQRNMDVAAGKCGFSWVDPGIEAKRKLLRELVGIARGNGMALGVCSQRELVVEGAAEAQCVDARRLGDLSGKKIVAKVKGNRPECVCHQSRDIGEYDTCPHGCAYCYAVRDHDLAAARFRRHDPDSEFLFKIA